MDMGPGTYNRITYSTLPYNYGNLPLPFIWGNYYGNIECFNNNKSP